MLYKYLKQNIKMISLYITIMILNAVILYFENVDKTAIMYSTSVILYIGIVVVLFGMFRFYKKSKVLERKSIPKKLTPIEEAYVDIINEKVEEIEKLKSENGIKRKEMMEFYTMWLHQVKTPIVALNFLLQEDEVKESANHKELENELFKIEQYVEMVLSYLRMESDSTDYDFEKYCLEDIVKQSVRKYARQFIRKKINVELNNLDMKIITDKKWLLFVIGQVLSNALKYTNEGKIKIYTDVHERLVIEDSGIGIAKEDLPRIFENGFTGYNGRIEMKSTGIGLYLCKNVMKNIGGDITADSEIHKGTKIFINLTKM